MAAENIGALVPTKIPGYADAADIQAALRLYHYGSYTYDINETDPAELVNPSIAYTLNDLQDQIDTVEGNVIQSTIFAAKGDLISASANDTPLILSAGSNNQFLIVNNATATGLQWTNTLTGPSVSGLYISDSSITFEGSVSDEFETTLTVTNPTADRTVTFIDASGNVVLDSATQTLTNKTLTTPVISSISNTGTLTLPTSTDTLVGRATTDTLTNKSISLATNTVTGTIAQFNTALTDADFATIAGTETLTNKTLTSPTISNPTFTGQASGLEIAFGQSIVFEGTTADDNELTLSAGNPTVDRTITFPDATGTVALTANNLGVFASTTSAQLAGVISDETGSGALVFATSPTLTTPNIGVATGTSFNSITALSSTTPLASGTAAIGTSTTVARADHVHPVSALTIGTGLSGTSYNGSSAVTIAIDSTVATLTGSQTLTNKTFNLSSNTLSGTIAQFNTALSDGDFATLAGTETLTNKTLTSPIINLSLNAQTGTTFTPALTDNGRLVTLSNASAITLTVPTNTAVSYATGAQINLLQLGVGQVTVVGDTGVTVYGTPGLKFRAQYSAATLIKLDTNTWLLTGDLSA